MSLNCPNHRAGKCHLYQGLRLCLLENLEPILGGNLPELLCVVVPSAVLLVLAILLLVLTEMRLILALTVLLLVLVVLLLVLIALLLVLVVLLLVLSVLLLVLVVLLPVLADQMSILAGLWLVLVFLVSRIFNTMICPPFLLETPARGRSSSPLPWGHGGPGARAGVTGGTGY